MTKREEFVKLPPYVDFREDVKKVPKAEPEQKPIKGGPNCNVCPQHVKDVCECW